MNEKFLVFAMLVIFSVLPISAQNTFPYETYLPRTVAEIVELNSDVRKADLKLEKEGVPFALLKGDFLYSQVRVRYMNKSRQISKGRLDLLNLWQKAFSIEDRIIKLYENEYLFKECDQEYWIPVQKQVAAYFPKELKEGDMISLFVIRVGGRKAADSEVWDWLFLANEFKKYS